MDIPNKNKQSTIKHSNKKIVVGLCTFHRNDLLDGAIESLSRNDLPDDASVEFVLVDNDTNGGAKEIFDYWHNALPFKSHYFIEPRQGIVHARNRVLEEALKLGATEIALFDDDEIVSQQWLCSLWNYYKNAFVICVGGPMYRLLPADTNKTLIKIWSVDTNHNTGDPYIFSTNNCLLSSELVRPDKMNLRFDEFFNHLGGEDSKFALDTIHQKCLGVAFVKEAVSVERFTKQRATFKYLLKRYFGSGNLVPIIFYRSHMQQSPFSLIRSILKFIKYGTFIPFAILFGKYRFWMTLAKAAQSAGLIMGFFHKGYEYYSLKSLKSELNF